MGGEEEVRVGRLATFLYGGRQRVSEPFASVDQDLKSSWCTLPSLSNNQVL